MVQRDPSINTSSKSRKFSDFDAQCMKIQKMKATEMTKYDRFQSYGPTLKDEARVKLMSIASTCLRNGGTETIPVEPRISYFWLWLLELREEDTLNYSEFARLIHVQRHVVSRQILPKAMHLFVKILDAALLCYLYAIHTPR